MSGRDDLRDPALDAAWRAHSAETPPADLDRAILAAAHRAAGSVPHPAIPAATRPWRWWMPLAAAATIGAIAIGVLQLSPPAHDATTAVVSDVPAMPGRAESPAPPRRPAEAVAAPGEAKRSFEASPDAPSTASPMRADPPMPKSAVRGDEPPMRSERGSQRMAPAAPTPRPFPAEVEPAARQPAAAAPSTPPPAMAGSAATARDTLEARDAREPHAWIARIRALHKAGDLEAASRELLAFRAAYRDADARLPADLRQWAATVGR
jgi:hypothetical protein